MIVISKAGYSNGRLMGVSVRLEDKIYSKIDEKYCQTIIDNINTALKCDNPIYICWEKYWMNKRLTAKDIMGLIK